MQEEESKVLDYNRDKTIMGLLGIEYTEFSPECVKCTMKITEKHLQPFGLMHGGVSGVIAESVASAGSYQFIDVSYQSIVGLELNMNHIRPGRLGEVITGVGVPIHVGRSTMVWEIKIYNGENKLVCISRCTVSILNKVSAVTQK